MKEITLSVQGYHKNLMANIILNCEILSLPYKEKRHSYLGHQYFW